MVWTLGDEATAAVLKRAMEDSFNELRLPSFVSLSLLHFTAGEVQAPPPDLVWAVPRYTTWARVRHLNERGPPPLRSKEWPWGFPWLTRRFRETAEGSNAQIEFILQTLQTVTKENPQARWALFQPEDLGTAKCTTSPASLWQLPEIQEWTRSHGLVRMTASQCEFHSSPTRCPIGFLSTASFYSNRIRIGWPSFSQEGRYLGPLPQSCSCGGAHSSENMAAPSGDNRARSSLLLPGFANWLCKRSLRELLVREGLHGTGTCLALTDSSAAGSGGQSDSDDGTVDLEVHGARVPADPKGFGNISLATELGLREPVVPEGNGGQEADLQEANGTQEVKPR